MVTVSMITTQKGTTSVSNAIDLSIDSFCLTYSLMAVIVPTELKSGRTIIVLSLPQHCHSGSFSKISLN